MLPSLRNIPILMWAAAGDQVVPYAGVEAQRAALDRLGYRYELDTFAPAEHLTLAFVDEWRPVADFLGTARVDRDPAHVTYVVNPAMHHGRRDGPADHAYWISRLRLRDRSGDAPLGTIDVRSEAFGAGDPVPSGTRFGTGVLAGGNAPALTYASARQDWSAPLPAPARDVVDIDARNIANVRIDVARAHLDCAATLHVTSDGPLHVALGGCGAG
jgi:hypothetical protein